MKKTAIFLIGLIALLLLCGCASQEENDMKNRNKTKPTQATEPATGQFVTFTNEVNDADIWILADTAANRKTTLWGTATLAKVMKGESRRAALCAPGEGELYLFRMIDVDGLYYEASGVLLRDGWTLTIKGDDLYAMTLEVTDASGALQNTYEVFAASL